MSALLSRMVLAAAAVLSLGAVYPGLFVIVESRVFPDDATALVLTNLACGAYFISIWIIIWQGQVKWTPRRVRRTHGAFWLAAVGASLIGWAIAVIEPIEEEGALVIGALAFLSMWIAATALAWRETPAERTERLAAMGLGAVSCPSCGYNLTGLREARCPECGGQFTLEELLGALVSESSTIEDEVSRV